MTFDGNLLVVSLPIDNYQLTRVILSHTHTHTHTDYISRFFPLFFSFVFPCFFL